MKKSRSIQIILWILLLVYTVPGYSVSLPQPAELEPAVKFWTKVYTDVGTNGGYIHDAENLEVIYREVHFPAGLSHRQRSKKIKAMKKRIKNILSKLAKGYRSNLSSEERSILNSWPQGVSNRTLRRASREVRFQLGQANKYKAGLIRSGKWRDYIEGVFRKANVPLQISLLPHVESSFNNIAYSKAGAAGLWQFTRGTGRRFMRVDHIVDERLDPYKATKAAAALLNHNHSVTGTWPLAITSYNHGSAGMRRAARVVGTTNIATIIKRYKGRTFGFASRNFYTSFLAAIGVDKNYQNHFGEVRKMQPISPKIFQVPQYIPAKNLSKALGINLTSLRAANPALRPSVWKGSKYVPKNFQLYLPNKGVKKSVNKVIASIPKQYRHSKQKRDVTYIVRRGNTLSQIARRFRVRVRDLMALNNIRRASRIRVGQRLRLPQRGQRILNQQVASAKKAKPIKVASAKKTSVSKRKNIPKGPFKGTTYRVKRGDTVYSIGKRFRVKQKTILALNGISRRGRIYPGQKLKIALPVEKNLTKKQVAVIAPKTLQGKNLKPQKDKTPVVVALNDQAKPSTIDSPVTTTDNNSKNQVDQAPAETSSLVNSASPGDTEAQAKVDNASGTPTTDEIVTSEKSIEMASSSTVPENTAVADETKKTSSAIDNEQLASSKAGIDKESEKPAVVDEAYIVKLEQQETAKLEAAEPASDQEATEVSPGLPTGGAHAQFAADPNDYEVGKNNTIEVHAEETLGHYADWLELPTQKLRRLNHMKYRSPVVVGKRIKLNFNKIDKEKFVQRRLAYHRGIQEDFFAQFHIDKTEEYRIRRGETLWSLTNKKFNLPAWLLRQHNPDIDFNNLHPKTKIMIPILKETEKPEEQQPPATAKLRPNAHSGGV